VNRKAFQWPEAAFPRFGQALKAVRAWNRSQGVRRPTVEPEMGSGQASPHRGIRKLGPGGVSRDCGSRRRASAPGVQA